MSLLVGGNPLVNDKYIPVYNAYSGQTETMQAKWANLKKWKNQGGGQILKEINEELNNSSGN